MQIREVIYQFSKMRNVAHTTLNPYGPGVVRVHLIPPKVDLRGAPSSVVVLNGQDIIPINLSWAILLNCFIEEVNKHEGKEISEEDLENIVCKALQSAKKVYPKTTIAQMNCDLRKIITTLCDVAYGKEPEEEIGYVTLGEYAPHMKAPHRMDLMVSSMVKNGHWHCNQKCLHCYAAGQEQAEVKELSTEEWKKVINKCREIGIPQLTFTGGEPTMRDDLVELIEHASWFVTRLNTNGVNLTSSLCDKLYQASLDSVQITLYSSVEDEHNTLVGAGNFKKTVRGIENAIKAGLNVSVNTPLCTINAEYRRTLEFLNELGVKYVSCSGLIVTGNACSAQSQNTQLSEDELYNILKSAKKFCEANHMEISFTSPGWVEQNKLTELGLTVPTCGACLSNMAIAPNGNVVPCQSWLSDDGVLGNILSDSWSKMWNSPNCKEKRDFSALMECACPLRDKEGTK